jgi:hypothetical protein
MIVGDFNTTLSLIHRSSKQKVNKEILELNDTKNQMDLTVIYRTFHTTTTQYTFFSASHENFSKIDHILGHKISLSKSKKIEIDPCILSDHNALKVELNNKNNSRKYAYNWRQNNTLLNHQCVIEETRQEIKSFQGGNEDENTTNQNLWDIAKAVLRGKSYSHECIY